MVETATQVQSQTRRSSNTFTIAAPTPLQKAMFEAGIGMKDPDEAAKMFFVQTDHDETARCMDYLESYQKRAPDFMKPIAAVFTEEANKRLSFTMI